jgi:hypothetical protein
MCELQVASIHIISATGLWLLPGVVIAHPDGDHTFGTLQHFVHYLTSTIPLSLLLVLPLLLIFILTIARLLK